MSAHLGETAAALVDGELDHAARERAQAHLAHCAECRAEVDAQRRLKDRLRLTAVDVPPVSADLTDRLLALAAVPHSAPARLGPTRPGGRPVSVRPVGRPRRRRRAAVGGAVVVLGLGAAFALGGTRAAAPRPAPVDPGSTVFVVDHATTSGEVPLLDPAAGVVTADLAR